MTAGHNFPDTLQRHQQWLLAEVPGLAEREYEHEWHNGGEPFPVMIVTCGRWDLCEMMIDECLRWEITPSPFYRRVINIKDAFQDVHGYFQGGMVPMLDYLGLALLGRHHSGIADSRNIARIAVRLAEQGYAWDAHDVIEVSANKYKPASNLSKAQLGFNRRARAKRNQ